MSLVEFGRYSDATLAHVVRGRLETAGIWAHCFDTGMNVAESVPMTFGVRVMVHAADLQTARQVIAAEDGASSVVDEAEDYNDEPFAGLDRKDHGRRQRTLARILVFVLLSPIWVILVGQCAARLN